VNNTETKIGSIMK